MASFMNIPRNVVEPFNFYVEGQLVGAVSTVATEVIMSKIIRMLMGDQKGILDLAYIHALSLPFLGGLQFGAPADRISKRVSGYTQQFIGGAKGIPAVLLAQYLVDTFTTGFHVPWFNMRDLLITAASKTLTKPLLFTVREYLPVIMANGIDIHEILVQLQEGASFGDDAGNTSRS